jgi:hypothetical protein
MDSLVSFVFLIIIKGIQAGIHTIIETHPSNVYDFRFNEPWEELLLFVNEFDFKKMDSMTSSHTPFIVHILHTLTNWKKLVSFIHVSIMLYLRLEKRKKNLKIL